MNYFLLRYKKCLGITCMHDYGSFAYTLNLMRVPISNIFPVFNIEFDNLSSSFDLYLFNKLTIICFFLACIHFFSFTIWSSLCLLD
jgi:hypothetical protein